MPLVGRHRPSPLGKTGKGIIGDTAVSGVDEVTTDRRIHEPAHLGHSQSASVGEAPFTTGGPVPSMPERDVHHGRNHDSLPGQRDEGAPLVTSVDETRRPVDGIEVPAATVVGVTSELLPHDVIAGTLPDDHAPERELDIVVHRRDQAAVGFLRHPEIPLLESSDRESGSQIHQPEGQSEIWSEHASIMPNPFGSVALRHIGRTLEAGPRRPSSEPSACALDLSPWEGSKL